MKNEFTNTKIKNLTYSKYFITVLDVVFSQLLPKDRDYLYRFSAKKTIKIRVN